MLTHMKHKLQIISDIRYYNIKVYTNPQEFMLKYKKWINL